MGCNCKASQYIRQTKKKYGYEPETIENVSFSKKIKLILRGLLIWVVIILLFPLVLLLFIFVGFFKKRSFITLFNAIKIRL